MSPMLPMLPGAAACCLFLRPHCAEAAATHVAMTSFESCGMESAGLLQDERATAHKCDEVRSGARSRGRFN